MMAIVDAPFGTLIAQDVNWELCWEDGSVYVFTHHMSKPTVNSAPEWTGSWNVILLGTPEYAKQAYPGYADLIDEVCV